MKVVVAKEFGNTSKKPLLPLVPEPTEILRKEELTTLELRSVPTDPNSAKVRFTFKMLAGGEPPREAIQWRVNVDRALTGLNLTTGTDRDIMIQQFCRGTALSTYNSCVAKCFTAQKEQLIADKEAELEDDDGTNATALTRELVDLRNCTQDQVLALALSGPLVITNALNQTIGSFMPNKILQRVKRYLRREARKPVDMPVKTYLTHILRINVEEIPRLPPSYSNAAILSDDEIIDILLFGTPKSWQREMDRQGFDPLTKSPAKVVAFMEQIEASEDFDADKKVVANGKKNNNNNKKKNGNNNNTSGDGEHYCMMHGKNSTHSTADCNTLKAQVKKIKGNNGGSNGNGKSKNKTWKNDSKKDTDDSKKELAALTKKIQKLSKKIDLNIIEPVKKRKVKWPTAEDEDLDLAAIDKELKDFNYGDLDQMDIVDGADEEKEDGEVDSISDEVSV